MMKAKAFIFTLMLTPAFLAVGAQSMNDIFSKETKITWLGLDFTAAKFIGDVEKWDTPDKTKSIIESMNKLMIKESAKYNVGAALGRPNAEMNLRVAIEHNKRLNMDDLVTDELSSHFLRPGDVQDIVNSYDFKGMTGTGVMFIVESFDKLAVQAVVWVTFMNMRTKEVLLTKRMADSPGGFGLRNYWAGSIYRILKKIKKDDYRMWRGQYAHQ